MVAVVHEGHLDEVPADALVAQGLVERQAPAARHEAQLAVALEGLLHERAAHAEPAPGLVGDDGVHERRAVVGERDADEPYHLVVLVHGHAHALDGGDGFHALPVGVPVEHGLVVRPRIAYGEQLVRHGSSFPT